MPPYPFVQLATLKQRTEKRPGQPAELPPVARLIVWFRFPITTTSASCR